MLCLVSPKMFPVLQFFAPVFDGIADIQALYTSDLDTIAIIHAFSTNTTVPDGFSFQNKLLLYRNRIFVPHTSDWHLKIRTEFHCFLAAGHSEFLRTYKHLACSFLWPGIKRNVKLFVAFCDVFLRNNYEAIRPLGLLQPLPIIHSLWQDISFDFVEGLPKSAGKNALLVVVDRLTKYGHFVPLTHPFTAAKFFDIFIKEIFLLHGMRKTIVSDYVFISNFWDSFVTAQGTQLCHNSSYHPQSDG